MTQMIVLAGVLGMVAIVLAALAGYSWGVTERTKKQLDEALWREFPSPEHESAEQRAQRLFQHVLPVFRTRDEALGALYLCYPTASDGNRLLALSAALYFLREEQDAKRERQRKEVSDITARMR